MSLRNAVTLAALGTTAGTAVAQVPAAPPIPAAPAVPAVPAAPAIPSAPAAAPRNIWSFFMLTPDQRAAKEAKKEKFCRSQFGQLLNNVAKPAAAITGGILPSCCPPSATDPLAPNPDDLKKPATDAEGAAARIKELEAGAAERREAVRYLGTVNCKRFPEAETALISSLRTDTNECVRFEAAAALARGCCCTTKTIKALTLTVDGTDTDGNPAETSYRVRAAAAIALAKCCTVEQPKSAPTPMEPPPELPPEKPAADAMAKRAEAADREKAMVAGRRAVAEFRSAAAVPPLVTGRRTVTDAVKFAIGPTKPAPVVPPPIAPQPVVQAAAIVIPTPEPAPSPPASSANSLGLPTGRRGLFDILGASR